MSITSDLSGQKNSGGTTEPENLIGASRFEVPGGGTCSPYFGNIFRRPENGIPSNLEVSGDIVRFIALHKGILRRVY